MSQSDYIKNKRLKAVLTKQSDLPAVLSSENYTNFSAFSTVHTVVNVLPDYDYIYDPTTVRVFNMVQPLPCVDFPLCSDEDNAGVYSLRGNRVLNPANENACSLVTPARPLPPKAIAAAQHNTTCKPIVRWPGDNRIK